MKAITTAASASPTIAVGDVNVTALLDVDVPFSVPVEEVFPGHGADAWASHRERYPEAFGPEGAWRYVVTCYLVRAGGRCVLVDTGCGPSSLAFPGFIGTGGALPDRLAGLEVSPEEIDTVLITHVHPDHVGGVMTRGAGEPAPAFPRARVLLPRIDWETWSRREVQDAFPVPYVGDTIALLVESGSVDLIDGPQQLTPELALAPTPGHTPGSTSVLIDSGGERAILVGDVWLHPAQVTDPSLDCGFDMDRPTARRTRSALAERIAQEARTMGACHFPEPFGQLVRLDGRHHWMPTARWMREER
jgi:glyoxylase-like metal-dependent hydrolase (beta-lactamase superfamily II)